MLGKGTAAVSAAAMAAAAALAGTASAQDQAQPSAEATTPAAPASTTPAPASTTPAPQPQPDGTTDLGTLEVQVPSPPKTSAPKTADQQRREGAKRFLKEEQKAQKDQIAQEQQDIASSPLDGLDNPLAVPPPEGVPNVTIDSFRIPPFLLPIYQAAGVEYGVRWEVLAAINEIETDYGRNLSVSTAGAVGWMQFMPGTWDTYGVDANNDGRKDPYNPVDAIFAAARYLRAAGAGENLQQAIFAYNHADWYVQDVLRRARTLAALPADVVGALSGLTMGRFPVLGESHYADGFDAKASRKGEATVSVAGTAGRKGARITTEPGAAAIAVQDGRVVRIGSSKRLGRFVRVRDVYGNTYTYGHLGSIATEHVVPRKSEDASGEAASLPHDPKPTSAATAGRRGTATSASAYEVDTSGTTGTAARVRPVKERLFADPNRPGSYHAGGERQLKAVTRQAEDTPRPLADGALGEYLAPPYGLRRNEVALLPLKEGSRVIAGTILGRVGEATTGSPNLRFEIRPAGSGAPRIDPTPILDGWKLLASTQVFRAQNPMLGGTSNGPTIGQILLMSKEALERRVLANKDISIYACGRQDIRAGIIDRRVLATMEFLAANDLKPTITSLRCGHGFYTASGNVSEHSSGDAMDIAAVNGTPIIGHQGAGSVTDVTVRRLLTLQGTMKPHQIITLMQYPGTDNTFAMGDHDDHIHVGFRPMFGSNPKNGKATAAILQPGQWDRLIGRLGAIQNPTVPLSPSKYSVKVKVKLRKKG